MLLTLLLNSKLVLFKNMPFEIGICIFQTFTIVKFLKTRNSIHTLLIHFKITKIYRVFH